MRKTHSRLKSLLCMILAVLMVVSSFTALGIVSVSAGAEEGIYLRGNMNGWNCYEEYKFVDEGNGIYTLILDMTGGNYEFKIATPTWSVAIGNEKNDNDNAILAIESDSIIKFTADTKTRNYTAESMNTKSDFTLGTTAQTIEAEKYTFALGAVAVMDESKASGGKYVGDFNEGDSLNYGVTVSGDKAQTYRFTINVASEADNGEFNFVTANETTKANFSTTGAWQTYKSLVFTKTLNPGYNRITIENTNGTYNVDKIDVQPVTDYADTLLKGETVVDFKGYDSVSDTAIVKNGAVTAGKGDFVSVIVDPEQDGVYTVSLDGEVSAKQLLLGDADSDGKVNVKDATAIQKAVADLLELNSDEELCANVDGNDSVNVKDATAIQKWVADMETGYAIGEYFSVSAARAAGQVMIGTDRDNLVAVTEDTTATLVIDGETEVFLVCDADSMTVNNLKFTYIPNVEQMGYEFTGDGFTGVRFANKFAIDKIVISGAEAGTLVFSDGTTETIESLTANGDAEINLAEAKQIDWVKLVSTNAEEATMQILGTKVDGSATDIALEGYATSTEGWVPTVDAAYDEVAVSKGAKLGFGFDKEVTVNKVVFVTSDTKLPTKATMTTADNKSVELTGTRVGNNVEFAIDNAYSFGFFFDFGEDVQYNAIQVYGDTAFKGASTNVSDEQDYTLFPNGLTENDSRAVANTGTHIVTSETGSDREWNLTEDISESPSFYAPNSPMAEAAYNLTMEEIYKSMYTDEQFGDVFFTGTNWHKVWTRDTAISMQYILSWLFPEMSTNCANAKVVGADGQKTFEEDTGTGGSYPVSTDRIIMMLAVWETYLADGNEETLAYFYDVASNTIKQDYEVVYDAESGLFRGETCGLDHRDKTYPDWTGEDDQNGIVNIAEGKGTNTNIIFCQVMKILSEAATILGKDEAEAKAWADLAADLEEAISTRLWHEDLGTYASWEYPDYMGSPLSYKQDVLANGYAVWYNIGTEEQVNSIMENHTLVNFGANTVYPNKNAQRWTDYKYHDSGVWPGWEALLMIGAVNNENENNLLAEEIWNSCVRGAVSCLSNYEVIDYETGEGLHSTQQLWSVAATMAGYYRVLYGMEYTTDGITFDPYVPDWMEGPFYVENYKYRDATLSMTLNGKGDTVESIYVNGEKVANDYVFPVDAKGEYNITINVKDSGAVDTINLKNENTAKAPTAPTNVTLTGTTLKWSGGTTSNVDYKVWTGSEYVDVTGTTYQINADKYGCYSVVAVDKSTGLWSELSKPVTYSPEGSNVTVNVGNHSDRASSKNPLTISVDIPVDGVYQLSAIHSNTNAGDPTSALTAAIRSVYVDGVEVGTLVFPISNFGHQTSTHLRLELTKGKHEVVIKYDDVDWYDRNMDQAHGGNTNNVTYHMIQFTLTDGDFDAIEPPAKKTVYFTNNQNWSKVNIFYWGGADSTEWPGTAMKLEGKNEHGQDIYSFELDPSTPNIVFNNGSEQTVDITTGVEDNAGFYLDAKNGEGKWTVGTWTYTP